MVMMVRMTKTMHIMTIAQEAILGALVLNWTEMPKIQKKPQGGMHRVCIGVCIGGIPLGERAGGTR